MLRQPSNLPVQEDGEVGASDDEDEESETEVEGHGEDDSDHETETENKQKTASTSLKDRLKGKTKAKPISSLATTAVQEEEESTTPPAPRKSFWALPTPSGKHTSSWTSFASTPSATPGPARGNDPVDGYFSSNASSSTASFATPRGVEPVLPPSGPALQGIALGTVVPPADHEDGSDDDASDEADSADSHGMSSQDHGDSTEPSPISQAQPPVTPQRPSFFSRASRSMVDLSESPAPSTGTQLETIRSREPAPGKIEIPSKPTFSALATPTTEWAKPPPTPAAGRAGFFWQKTKEGKEIGTLKRRRSADDLTVPPPKYTSPLPGVSIPRPRDEEGKEKLPKYWCAVRYHR